MHAYDKRRYTGQRTNGSRTEVYDSTTGLWIWVALALANDAQADTHITSDINCPPVDSGFSGGGGQFDGGGASGDYGSSDSGSSGDSGGSGGSD